jgi:septum formation protein
VIAAGIPEAREGGTPEELVLANARAKAAAVREARGVEDAVVLGADTDVVLDGVILGKPGGPDEARALLGRLSGRDHVVLTALVALGPGTEERAGIERTVVTFAELSERDIELYLRSGEWEDRAGGYAVQGLGSKLVAAVEGDLSNVIGMPMRLFAQLLPAFLPKP